MEGMRVVKLICLLCFLGSIENIHAQKWWDGEGKDSLWSNPKNWYPDGVPLPTDDVVVDNSKLTASYKIWMNGPDSIRINSLKVSPTDNQSITLEIPSSNTLPLAVYINSSGKNIILEKGAILINSSGATSGNTFLLNGTLYIQNGGKYIHKTIRGNAYLISKLEIDSTTKKGMVEFDVPGSSGYTLSLSGRKFGSLSLSALQSTKKTYSGSGSNILTIEGDLIIQENASLASSLNANIVVNGDLLIKGICALNPSTTDSIGRDFIWGGDSTILFINGKFSGGIHFRNFVINGRWKKMLSVLELSNISVKSTPFTQMVLDTFYIKTNKSIILQAYTTVQTAHPEGISADSTRGSLRASSLAVDSSSSIEFTGKTEQHSGNAIPPVLRSLIINKNGGLILDKSLMVKDSLQLIKGFITTDSLHQLKCEGRIFVANENGFVNGPLEYHFKDSSSQLFPLGKKLLYAPLIIQGYGGNWIEAEYFDTSASVLSTKMNAPVKEISKSEYWTIKKIKKDSTNGTHVVQFSKRTNSKDLLNGTIHGLQLNDTGRWEMLPLIGTNAASNSIQTKTDLKATAYTLGTLQQIALAGERFQLKKNYINGKHILNWTYDSNETTIQYIIESSTDGVKFIVLDSVKTSLQNRNNYTFELNDLSKSIQFFRIKACHKDGRFNHSNILHIQIELPSNSIFPNPCHHHLYLKVSGSTSLQIIAVDVAGIKKQLNYEKTNIGYRIDVASLKKGFFQLWVLSSGDYHSYNFIKY